MPWAAAAVAGGAVLGGIAGSQGKQASSTEVSAPWTAQQPYLTDVFSKAQDTYNQRSAQPFYTGELYARMNPTQQAAINSGVGFANGTGAALASGVSGSATGALGASAQFGHNAGALFSRASADPTQSTMSAASQYASSPYADGMVDAATRDVSRTLNQDTLPQNNLDAAGTGNMNSSRAGVIDAQARRDAGDRVADISAGIRGDLYNNGLQLAESQRQTGLSAGLSANAQLGQQADYGLNAAQVGSSLGYGAADAALGYGGALQSDQQNQDNADFTRYQGNDQRKQDLLSQYMTLIQGKYGGTVDKNSTQGGGLGGALQGVIGGASLGGGLYGNLQ